MHAIAYVPATSPWWRVFVLVVAATVAACESDEPDLADVPEVAEVEVDPVAVAVGPEGTSVVAEVRLEEVLPLTPDDVGKLVVATGFVVGRPLPMGFFLRSEGMEVLFVNTTTPVAAGAAVRVVGRLQRATALTFDEWELEAFQREVELDTFLHPGARKALERAGVTPADFRVLTATP